jgi:DNA-binding NtrC family response regulator
MITAYSLLEDAVKALNLGAFSYLAKPINMGELLVKIDRALEKQALDKELQEEIRKLEDKNREVVERELRIIEMEKELEALKREVGHV